MKPGIYLGFGYLGFGICGLPRYGGINIIMALNAKRRQKKLAKKASKRKAKRANLNRMKRTGSILSGVRQIVRAANSPIHECFVPENLFDRGIGSVVISRKMPDGNIGFGIFLVDTYCLGIKDALVGIKPQWEYDDKIRNDYKRRENLQRIHPSCARKLIEGAVDYANDLGFSPHRDYRIAKKIFGDIDSNVCPTSFEYGKDGKPFFIAGPYDTPKRCKMIMDTLTKRCGEDGFHFIVPEMMNC